MRFAAAAAAASASPRIRARRRFWSLHELNVVAVLLLFSEMEIQIVNVRLRGLKVPFHSLLLCLGVSLRIFGRAVVL